MPRRNKYRNRGSPYLIPLEGWKGSNLLLLKRVDVDVDVDVVAMQLIIKFMVFLGKLKCSNTILIKLHSKRS